MAYISASAQPAPKKKPKKNPIMPPERKFIDLSLLSRAYAQFRIAASIPGYFQRCRVPAGGRCGLLVALYYLSECLAQCRDHGIGARLAKALAKCIFVATCIPQT